MEWYVVNTFSGYENSVKKSLEERIKSNGLEAQFAEILIPSEKVTERRGKSTVQKTNKFFPGYIFISMELTKASWHLVQTTPKVTGFLGGQNPRPVRKAEMSRTITAITKMAQSDERIVVKPAVFDRHPFLLNCLNGTIDLATGDLLPASGSTVAPGTA